MDEVIAERKFTIDASRERLWAVLGRAIIDSLELEQFYARDDRNFSALTRVKVVFITVTMQVRGEMSDVSPPESLSVLLEVKGIGGIVQLNQKVTFTLDAVDTSHTQVVCKSTVQNIGLLRRIILIPMIKSFTKRIFENTEKLFRRLA